MLKTEDTIPNATESMRRNRTKQVMSENGRKLTLFLIEFLIRCSRRTPRHLMTGQVIQSAGLPARTRPAARLMVTARVETVILDEHALSISDIT